MTTNYQRGINLENKIRKLFQDAGYDVIRGAGSKGKVLGFDTDLVASRTFGKNEDTVGIVLLQCKRKKIN